MQGNKEKGKLNTYHKQIRWLSAILTPLFCFCGLAQWKKPPGIRPATFSKYTAAFVDITKEKKLSSPAKTKKKKKDKKKKKKAKDKN